MNVWHLLAVHVPNLVPETIFGFDLPWLRKGARLLYSIVLFAIVEDGFEAHIFGTVALPVQYDDPD